MGNSVTALATTPTTVYAGGDFLRAAGNGRLPAGRVQLLQRRTAELERVGRQPRQRAAGQPGPVQGRRRPAASPPSTAQSSGGIGAVDAVTGASTGWSSSFPLQDASVNAGFTSLTTDGTQRHRLGLQLPRQRRQRQLRGPLRVRLLRQPHLARQLPRRHLRHLHPARRALRGRPLARLLRRRRVGRHQPADLSPRAGRDADAVGPAAAAQHQLRLLRLRRPAQQQPVPLVPHAQRRHVHRADARPPGRSPATATTSSLGGEFPKINGKAQQGLVRFAVPRKAPLKWPPVRRRHDDPDRGVVDRRHRAGAVAEHLGRRQRHADLQRLPRRRRRRRSTRPPRRRTSGRCPGSAFTDTGPVARLDPHLQGQRHRPEQQPDQQPGLGIGHGLVHDRHAVDLRQDVAGGRRERVLAAVGGLEHEPGLRPRRRTTT